MPKASFVVPVYNGDAYLAETIESIRNQTEKDIEIIVVDDCSPDFTEDLMEWYVKQDPRIRYFRLEENQGVCYARNFGNEKAESEYIFVNDQDDLSMPERVKISLEYMEAHPEVDCITSAYEECDVRGRPVRVFTPEDMTRDVFLKERFTWFHSSACYRRKDVLLLPYRVVAGNTDDWTFLDDWTSAGKKFKTIDKVLARCRRLPWGVMQQRRAARGMAPSYVE